MPTHPQPETSPVEVALADAPLDDEPYTDEERREDERARADLRAGKGISTAELRRLLGI